MGASEVPRQKTWKWHQLARVLVICIVLGAWAAVLALAAGGYVEVLLYALKAFLGASFFILFCAGGIPEDAVCCPSDTPPPTWARMLCASALFAVNVVGTLYPWMTGLARDPLCNYWYEQHLVHPRWDGREQVKNWGVFILDTAACWITGSLSMYCVCAPHPPSKYIRDAVRFIACVWFEGFWFMIVGSLALCGDPTRRSFFDGRATGRDVGFFTNAANMLWVSFLVLRRLRVLEKTFGAPAVALPLFRKFSQQLGACLLVMCSFEVGGNIFATIALDHGVMAYSQPAAIALAIACGCMGVCLLQVVAAFRQPLQALLAEVKEASDIPAAEALWAWRNLRLERNAIVMSMVMSMADLVMRTLMGLVPGMGESVPVFIVYVLLWDLRDIVDAFSIAVLCGFLGKSQRDECAGPAGGGSHHTGELVGTYDAADCELARHPASGDPAWSSKVEDLAARGFELARLLDFFEELISGSTMPGFDPLQSTTNDVVRQAIIPLSREQPPLTGGRALASIWASGAAVWPERMVTHSWSNLFLHLVAAVVGDALGEGVYYEAVAQELCSPLGISHLRRRLRECGGLELTYWVCAFSVNQHAGICGGFGNPPAEGTHDHELWMRKRLDTTTGAPHPACTCQQPKFFSNEPVQCEMNKFDDMLDLLMERTPNFRQVIAMDQSFDLLRRCWCLAEIVRTSNAGMPQNTLILSTDAMDAHYDLLATIDVRECEASNPDDKAFILGKIHSTAKFNAQLQWLVFSRDGIFGRQLTCPRDRVQAAARVAARVDRRATRMTTMSSAGVSHASGRTRTSSGDSAVGQTSTGRTRTTSVGSAIRVSPPRRSLSSCCFRSSGSSGSSTSSPSVSGESDDDFQETSSSDH